MLVFMFAGDRSGVAGGAIRRFLLGMNGAAAYVLPLFIILGIVIWSLKQPLKTAVEDCVPRAHAGVLVGAAPRLF